MIVGGGGGESIFEGMDRQDRDHQGGVFFCMLGSFEEGGRYDEGGW